MPVPDTERIDLRIKRLTAIETEYHHRIKEAQSDMRVDPDRKKKYERVIAKYERKMDKLLPKIRHLRELRHSRKSR